jgi:hypothetical protein
MKKIALLIILSGFLTACGNKTPNGTYKGYVLNETKGAKGTLDITFEDKDGLFATMEIGFPLSGGGAFNVEQDGKNIKFVTASIFGRIYWSGRIKRNRVEGTFVANSPLGSHNGVWRADKQ